MTAKQGRGKAVPVSIKAMTKTAEMAGKSTTPGGEKDAEAGTPQRRSMKFRKKPVVIDAVRATCDQYITTLEGVMKANAGDWIITGVKGEKYPCKPDIFEATYEPVEAP